MQTKNNTETARKDTETEGLWNLREKQKTAEG